jgi:hypothetical protein
VTGLPTGQQRALNRIEKTLADDDPGLGPLFAIFTRLVGHEAMPATERVPIPTWRRRQVWQLRAALVTIIGLAAVTGTIVFSQMSGRPVCPGTVTAAAAHVRSAGTGRLLACTSRPTGQAVLRGR